MLMSREHIGYSIILVFQHRFYLLAQLGRVGVTVSRNRMLHGRIEHFFFAARNF